MEEVDVHWRYSDWPGTPASRHASLLLTYMTVDNGRGWLVLSPFFSLESFDKASEGNSIL